MAPDTSHNQPSDEIDLRELFISLWQAKVVILSVTAVIACIAAAYAFLSAPIYQTSVRLLPPKASDLASYNAASQLTGNAISGIVNQESAGPIPTGIQELTTKIAYSAFLQNLDSDKVKLKFFEEYYLPAHGKNVSQTQKQALWKRLNKELTIDFPKKPNDVATTLSLEGRDPEAITDWMNHYVSIAATATQKDFLQDLANDVGVRSKGVLSQISTLRKVAKTLRESSIVRVENALAMAESIGLESPPPSSPLILIGNAKTNDTNSLANGNIMYLRGAKALRAELRLLKSRKNDDAYIPELGDLLKKQNLLSSIDLNPAHLTVVDIDSSATVPQEPIKPKKILVLAIGVILGAMLGVLAAIIRKTFSK